MRDALLVAWLALLGATRVDLLAEQGPFVLTPFLVLSPVVVASELWRFMGEGWEVRVPPRAVAFILTVSTLVGLALVSTFLAYDLPTAARRFSLLFVQVYVVILVGISLLNRADAAGLLVKGAYAAVGLMVVMNLAQLVVWRWPVLWPDPFSRVLNLEPGLYFGVIPRLTGMSHDPNLGGLLLAFYLALLAILAAPSRLRTVALVVGALAVVATLSRSAALAGLVVWGGLLLRRLEIRVTPRGIGVLGAAAGAVTLVYLFVPGVLDPVLRVLEMVGHRLAPEEGSASEHTVLLLRGWEVGTETLKHALFGIGYGNAYTVVQDIFPGNEYGNFHSLWVTFFAETGAPAALVAVALFLYPLLRGGPYWPLVAGLIVYNLFQQAHTDPVLWLALMLAWTGTGTDDQEHLEPDEP